MEAQLWRQIIVMNKMQTAVLGTLLATALVGCGDDKLEGQAVDFNGAKVTTWAKLDDKGAVAEVGFTIPFASIQNAGSSGSTHDHPVIFTADFPKQVSETTSINHFEFDWMPGGHEPARYMAPHFDFHFYMVDKATVAAVDCTNGTQADPAIVPDGWFPAVPPDTDPKPFCIPNMGYHALPASEFTSPGVFKEGLFDKVMLSGFYNGKLTFIEPMITKAQMEKKESFTLPVPQPKSFGRATLHPTSFKATYDADENAYDFVLSDFKSIQ